MNIWQKCPRTAEVRKVEKKVQDFLRLHALGDKFSLQEIESWIYHCPLHREDKVFEPLLGAMQGCRLKDLMEFDTLFHDEFFPQVPQKVLSGLSPVRYALNLKRLQE